MHDTRNGRRWAGLAAIAAALAIGLAACGGDDDDGAEDGAAADGGPTTVTVGAAPVVDMTPMQVAISEGYFEEEGLEIETVDAPFGPEGVAALVGGSYDIGFSATTDVLEASSQGVPVRIIAGGRSAEEGMDSSALIAAKDAGISGLEDLDGKQVAITASNSLPDMGLRAALDAEGLDPEGFEPVELDFPDQGAALEQGRIDAAVTVEPFAQVAIDGGAERVSDVFGLVLAGLPSTVYTATDEYVSDNQDVVAGFARALERGVEDAEADSGQVRRQILEFTEIPRPVAQTMALPTFVAAVSPDQMREFADFATQWGGLKEEVDVEELVAEVEP